MSIHKYQTKKGVFYLVKYRKPDGSSTSKRGFERKTDAKYWEAVELPKVLNTRAMDNTTTASVSPKIYTLAWLVSEFLSYRTTSSQDSTEYDRISTIQNNIYPAIPGTTPIHELTGLKIVEWQKWLNDKKKPDGTKLSHKYKSKIFVLFKSIIKFASDFYGLKENPFRNIRGFKNMDPHVEMSFLDLDEWKSFYSVIDDVFYQNAFSMLYLTGIRRGEMQALKVGKYDRERKEITIDHTWGNRPVQYKDGERYRSPKTPNSIRTIKLFSSHAKQFEAFLDLLINEYGFTDDSFIFGAETPISATSLERMKNLYIEKAKLKKIRIHDFRHSHVSLLIHYDMNIVYISRRLGHKNIEMTWNKYSHFFPAEEQRMLAEAKIDL